MQLYSFSLQLFICLLSINFKNISVSFVCNILRFYILIYIIFILTLKKISNKNRNMNSFNRSPQPVIHTNDIHCMSFSKVERWTFL